MAPLQVYAVIVCYHPAIDRVAHVCAELQSAGVRCVVVDNTEDSYLDGQLALEDGHLIVVGENAGIARAQNVGVRVAIDNGADAILFLDQDSLIDGDCVLSLAGSLRRGEPMVIAPVCLDEASGDELPAVELGKCGLPAPVYAAGQEGPRSVDIIISSGTLATREALAIAGPMDERLFIDFVDTEWCLRCRRGNVPIQLIPRAILRHTVGTRSFTRGPLTVLVHSPTRCYYQIRNCFLLFRMKHVPFAFALHQTAAVLVSRLLLLLATGRVAYARAYAAGVLDGLRGAVGKREVSLD